MTDRLDRIEALLESTGQKLNRTAEQQAKHTEDIDTLLGAIATTEALVNRVTVKAKGNELICDTIRAEARADRLETRQLWNDAITQMETDRAKAQTQAEVLRAETATDRQEFRQNFNNAIAQMRIDREETKKLADTDGREAGERAETDRQKTDDQHSAQMKVIQTLLLGLTKTNGNTTKLRDRIDGLEKAN